MRGSSQIGSGSIKARAAVSSGIKGKGLQLYPYSVVLKDTEQVRSVCGARLGWTGRKAVSRWAQVIEVEIVRKVIE